MSTEQTTNKWARGGVILNDALGRREQAIEFAEYMAKAAEAYITEVGDCWDLGDEMTESMIDKLNDKHIALQLAIYEFRKRVPRKPMAEHKELAKAPPLRGDEFNAVLEGDDFLTLSDGGKLRFVSTNNVETNPVLMYKGCIPDEQRQQLIDAGVKITGAIEQLHQAFRFTFEKRIFMVDEFNKSLQLFDRSDIKPKTSKPFFRKNERW